MSVILIMIPAALLLAGFGVFAFVLAAKRGQFDDLDTPALRAVFDDDDTQFNKDQNKENQIQDSEGTTNESS